MGKVSKGLTKEQIDKLPVKKYYKTEAAKKNGGASNKETECCSVCLCEISYFGTCIELPCKHIFHDECLKKWLEQEKTCPVCKELVL